MSPIDAVTTASLQNLSRRAYHFLLTSTESVHYVFDREQQAFLRRSPHATAHQRPRRLEFIERQMLECSFCPHLFWRLDQTFTHERTTDVGRYKAPTLEQVFVPDADPYADEEDNDSHRHSVKRRLARLCLSPLLRYASSFEVCQFAYDLAMWSTIGGRRNMNKLAPALCLVVNLTAHCIGRESDLRFWTLRDKSACQHVLDIFTLRMVCSQSHLDRRDVQNFEATVT